jgi:hydrogenase maturation protease
VDGSTLIIGLGNPLRGDDGVGVRVVQTLATYDLPPNIRVIDGMEGQQRVIIVDAADIGASPGQFVRFMLPEARLLGDEASLSIHAAGLREALLLAQALDMLPPELIIYGVQPRTLAWDNTLSSSVEAGLPGLISAILAEAACEPT